jgi:prophage regulatory protein
MAISLGGRSVGWPETEVIALNTARIAGKTDAEVRVLVQALEADRKKAM